MTSTTFHSFVHETDEATVTDHSLYGEFLPLGCKQLAVISAKVIRFYRFNPYALVPSHRYSRQTGSWVQKTRLECVYTMKLLQPVKSAAVIRLADQELDSILLAFDEARVSIIGLHYATQTMRTLHLYSIEEEFLRTGHLSDVYPPTVIADTENRCSILIGYEQNVAVIPHVGSDLTPFHFELKSVDPRIQNVLDVCFLHQYDQPTLLVMFEPLQATVGRAILRQDTVCIIGISLNLAERTYAAVWSLNGLPSELSRVVPIPAPVGGVFALGEGCAVYLSQSTPSIGVSVNVYSKEYTRFPLEDRSEYQLSWPSVRAVVIDPTEVLLVDGSSNMHVLSLMTDANHAVHDFKITKIIAEVSVPRTLTAVWDGFIFLGSRLGDSMLLQYSKKESADAATEDNAFGDVDESNDVDLEEDDLFLYDSAPAKRKIAPPLAPQAVKKVKLEDTTVQPDVNGEEKENSEKLDEVKSEADDSIKEENDDSGTRSKVSLPEAEYEFSVVDMLPNIGPCKVVKPSLPDLHPVYQSKKRPDPIYDLVASCGHGKSGSLNFFQRTIRPVPNITYSLDGIQQVFAVGRQEDESHAFVLAARETSTLVFEITSGDLLETALPVFNTTETTIAAGDLYDGAIAVQVTPTGFTLVADQKIVETVNLNINFPVISGSILDEYIAMMTQNGRLLLYKVALNGPNVVVEHMETKGLLYKEDLAITALCLYRDMSGFAQFCKKNPNKPDEKWAEPSTSEKPEKVEKDTVEDEFEDDFDLLYATKKEESEAIAQPAYRAKRHGFKDENLPTGAFVQNPDFIEPKYFLFVASETSNVQVYLLPSMQLVFNSQKLCNLPNVLKHKNAGRTTYEDAIIGIDYGENRDAQGGRPEDAIVELVVLGMGYNQARPILAVLVDDMVVLYEMFSHDDHLEGSLAVRFRKLPHCVVTRLSKYSNSDGKLPVEAIKGMERYRSKLIPFERIGSMTHGLFVAGGYPTFFFMQRGEMRQHAMTIDGPIHAFSGFNSPACPYGFMYLNLKASQIRICCLQDNVEYDMSFPVRRVPLGETVHRAQYILESDIIVLVTSRKQTTDKYCVLLNDEKVVETVKREICPEIERFSIKLFSFEDFKIIPNSELEMEEFEAVTACEEVLLHSESTITGLKNYVGVGTSASYGDEVVVRGRIVIYEVIEVVPEPGFPTSKHKLKAIFDKEQKGAVASICSCDGYLLTGIGPKVFIWQLRDNALHGISFLDLSYYVHHLTSYGSLALALDMKRSVSLLRYQEKFKALSLASRDHRTETPAAMATSFIFDKKHTGILMSDESGAISIFTYAPHLTESSGGEKLILNGYIQLGSPINSFIRCKPHVTDPMIDNPKEQSKIEKVEFATLDGSFGAVKPITEKMGRRLYYLQTEIINKLSSPAGLNGRTARGITVSKMQGNMAATIGNNVGDGRICMEFLNLSQTEKNEIARGVGCSKYNLIDDLTELQRLITQY
uniref:CPSF_A domain-containing protein n=1 Tax=Steinernema glaseri TaxID=37863 RepID=A0A1I8AI22_9BILA